MTDLLVSMFGHGVAFVFANILIERLGVPIPGAPTLIVAGALAANGRMSLAGLVAATLVACVIGDTIWYALGRRYGVDVLRYLCRISLSPDSCVRKTEDKFDRWGMAGLVVGKFIPGIATVAAPLAGATKVSRTRFLFFSTLGSVLWAGVAIGAGVLLRHQIAWLIERFQAFAVVAFVLVAVTLVAYIAFKWWQRRRVLSSR